MSIAFLNGKFLPLQKAQISVMDRGFLFGDGVFELVSMYHGKPFRLQNHLSRMQHSLDQVQINYQIDTAKIERAILQLIKLNKTTLGTHTIYVQITRGVAPERSYYFTTKQNPTILIFIQEHRIPTYQELKKGKVAVTLEDIRWKLCHIKATSLLPSIMLYAQVKAANADEGILLRHGRAVEGISSNVYMVKKNVIYTPPLSKNILSGVTRDLIIQLAKTSGVAYKEKSIRTQDLATADEIWISSSGRGIFPIIKLNGKKLGSGRPGPVWDRIVRMYIEYQKSKSLLDPASCAAG